MGYQSLKFLLFSSAVVLLYYAVGKFFKRGQQYVLLLANLAFYAICGLKYLPFLAVTLLASFFSARAVGRIFDAADRELTTAADSAQKKQIRAAAKKKAKRSMLFGVLISLALLVVCKYSLFVLKNVNAVLTRLGAEPIGLFKMILPLGISFYTFMAVGYVLDVYWKRIKAEKSFVSYAVFLTYFPHIVQGPIGRYKNFREQFDPKAGVALNTQNLAFGAELVVWGLFKKLVIADRLSLFVSTIFDEPAKFGGLIMVIAAVLYSVQIYADFSGCIDIVSGVSEMLGIKLAKNFNHPYFSRTIPEFWRRWHISLGEWFKDFVYFPVSTSSPVKKLKKAFKKRGFKKGELLVASSVPTVVVWVITGLWHGASWNFVAWGAFYAVLMVGGNVFADFNKAVTKKLKIDTEQFGWKLFQMLRTFALCCVGRVFFRAEGLRNALVYFKNMFSSLSMQYILEDKIYTYGLDRQNFIFVIFAILVLLVADILEEKIPLRETLSKQNIVFRYCVILLGVFAVLIFGIYGPQFNASEFIYEKF